MDMLAFPIAYGQKTPSLAWTTYQYRPRNQFTNQNAGVIPYVNGCIVIDLDFYKVDSAVWDKHPLKQILAKQPKTFEVRTGSGGTHLYFKDEIEFKDITKLNKENFDIIRRQSYVVAPGSFNSKTNEYYRIIHNVNPSTMTDELKQFICNLQRNKARTHTKEYTTTNYKFEISEEEVEKALKKMPKKKQKQYWDETKFWNRITIAMKTLGCKDLWERWSMKSKKYNQENNEKRWDFVSPNPGLVFWLFKECKTKYCGGYKPIDNTIDKQPVIETNERYVQPSWFEEGCNYLVKSDKGTGKSTAFLSFCKSVLTLKPNQRFLSIVSRRALCKEQKRKAEQVLGIKITYYEDYKTELTEWKMNGCQGIQPTFQFLVTTPESLSSVYQYKDEIDTIVFIDEFNSVLEHVFTSSTMEKVRIKVFDIFVRILTRCGSFVCADADISPVCQEFLDTIKVKYRYILNTYQPFKGVQVSFHKEDKDLVKQIHHSYKHQEPFFVLCDSKKISEKLYNELTIRENDPISLITSKRLHELEDDEDDCDIDLQNTKYMICSPKIVYGLDSNTKRTRKIYCYFTGNTISPPQMVQQVTREREPISVDIYYDNPSSNMPNYINRTQADTLVQSLRMNQGRKTEWLMEGVQETLFSSMMGFIEYRKDCYATSKFHHLCCCLKESGFEVNNPFTSTGLQTGELTENGNRKLNSCLENNHDFFYQKGNEFGEKVKQEDPKVMNYLSYFNIKSKEEYELFYEIFEPAISDTFFANEPIVKMYKMWKLLQLDYNVIEQTISNLKDYETSKMLQNQKKQIEFCIRVMDYFQIDIHSIIYEPTGEPIKKDMQDIFKTYIKALNRRVDVSKNLTDTIVYSYFKRQMMKLMPFEIFTIKKEKKGTKKTLCYQNKKNKPVYDWQYNPWLSMFNALRVFQRTREGDKMTLN